MQYIDGLLEWDTKVEGATRASFRKFTPRNRNPHHITCSRIFFLPHKHIRRIVSIEELHDLWGHLGPRHSLQTKKNPLGRYPLSTAAVRGRRNPAKAATRGKQPLAAETVRHCVFACKHALTELVSVEILLQSASSWS